MAEWIQPLFARASDNVSPNATVTITSGTGNAEYPPENLVDLRPDLPAKLTGTSGTFRFTWSGNQVIVGIVVANHNLAGATVTLSNAAGVNQALTVPAYSGRQSVSFWRDLRDDWTLAQRTDDVWDLAITGAATPVAVGEVIFLTDLEPFNLIWGVTFTPEWDIIQHRTFGRSKIQYDKRIVIHKLRGQCNLDDDYATLRALHSECSGPLKFLTVIPDEDTNEAFLMAFTPTGFSFSPTDPGIMQMPIELEQVSNGPPLFA